MKNSFLGEFEQMLLLAVLRLGREAYGRSIRQELEEQTGRRVSRGAAYVTLDRLEKKGYLLSRMGESLPERGGRARRYFTVTTAGTSALRDSRNALLQLWQGLEPRLEET